MTTTVTGIKPFNDRMIELERKMLENKIANMTDLPTLPDYLFKIMRLLKDENAGVNKLVDVIEQDQSLVSQLLKLVNSGFYGVRKTVTSVSNAVTLLGMAGIKQLVYSTAVMDFYSEKERIEWEHAYSSSLLMNKLLKENNIPVAENLTLTTLMHDVGKLVLKKFTPHKYAIVLDTMKANHVQQFEAENEILHIDHACVGGIVMEKWGMAEDIIVPIVNHHSDKLPDSYVLESILLQIVNYVDCTARGIYLNQPKQGILRQAGIESFDYDHWIQSQIVLINDIAKQG